MQRQLLLSIGSLLFSISTLAAAPIDSIGVENLNGKKIIVHKVEPKESYYSLSRKYKVSPQSIIDYNSNKPLPIGVIVKVPTERAFASEKVVSVAVSAKESQVKSPATLKTIAGTHKPVAGKALPVNKPELPNAAEGDKTAVVDYKVGAKETFYSIARKFNTSVEAIKSLNNITRNTLAAGQILKIRYGTQTAEITPPSPVTFPGNLADSRSVIDSSINAGERLRLPPARYGLREVDERGVAFCLADESLDGSKMLALHRTAPIGTVVKITNTMTNRSTFAKVVGKFTENESTRDVIIVLTKSAANMIGALDKRFQVNIVYGVPHE